MARMEPTDSPLVAIVDDDELFRRSIERLVGQLASRSKRSARQKTSWNAATWIEPPAPFST